LERHGPAREVGTEKPDVLRRSSSIRLEATNQALRATDAETQFGERAMKFTVTSGEGAAKVVDRPANARTALELVLALLGRQRRDIRIFDEDGRRRTPADLCRLAADEVAMLPDEPGLSF
jgi:hypothetical protein